MKTFSLHFKEVGRVYSHHQCIGAKEKDKRTCQFTNVCLSAHDALDYIIHYFRSPYGTKVGSTQINIIGFASLAAILQCSLFTFPTQLIPRYSMQRRSFQSSF